MTQIRRVCQPRRSQDAAMCRRDAMSMGRLTLNAVNVIRIADMRVAASN